MRNRVFNSKGQAGSVFKLLIGAVIGLAILGIIYSIILVMNNQKTYLSSEVFSNKIKMAMKNPTGSEYKIDDYSFASGNILSKKALAEQTGLKTNCITLVNTLNTGDVVSNDPNNVNYFSFTKDNIVDIGVLCNVRNEAEDCPIECELSVYDRSHK